MTNLIAIRVDGNSEIGFGHLIRTQALARQLEKRGVKVVFFSRNPENIRDYKVEALEPGVGFEAEDEIVDEMLIKHKAQMLIIDSYFYGRERLNRMAALDLITVYIDDMNRHDFNVDYVINGNLYAPGLDYLGTASCLLGSEYLMMREEFSGLPSRWVEDSVNDVLISFGAADMGNITPKLLQTLFSYERFSDLNWHVVIGPVFRSIEEIKFLVRDRLNVFLYNNPDIKKLMEICDISISAAGSTTYELAACGVPALLVVAADNQLKLAYEAEQRGFAINLGWHYLLDKSRLNEELDNLIDNKQMREDMAARGQALIDGRGAERVAEILLTALGRDNYE